MSKVVALSAVLILTVFLIFGASISLAQEKNAIGGKMSCEYADQKQFNIGDNEGHMLSVIQSTGKNASLKVGEFMDGAAVVNYSMGDLVKGSGEQYGYIMFVKGADTTFAKWDHTVTTTVTPERKNVTTFKGRFKFTRGTGQFKRIRGSGFYDGAFTSPTEYSVEWKGEYSIKKK